MRTWLSLIASLAVFSMSSSTPASEAMNLLPRCHCIAGEDLLAIQAALSHLKQHGTKPLRDLVVFVHDEGRETITVAFRDKEIAFSPILGGGGLAVELNRHDLSLAKSYYER